VLEITEFSDLQFENLTDFSHWRAECRIEPETRAFVKWSDYYSFRPGAIALSMDANSVPTTPHTLLK
jgi:hypothetical protein